MLPKGGNIAIGWRSGHRAGSLASAGIRTLWPNVQLDAAPPAYEVADQRLERETLELSTPKV